jgi:hypothetical protein
MEARKMEIDWEGGRGLGSKEVRLEGRSEGMLCCRTEIKAFTYSTSRRKRDNGLGRGFIRKISSKTSSFK